MPTVWGRRMARCDRRCSWGLASMRAHTQTYLLFRCDTPCQAMDNLDVIGLGLFACRLATNSTAGSGTPMDVQGMQRYDCESTPGSIGGVVHVAWLRRVVRTCACVGLAS